MKFFLHIVALVLAMNACNTMESKGRNLNIPDTIKMIKTSQHVQVPGTRLFIVVPSNYKFSKLHRLTNENGTDILIGEYPGKPFKGTKTLTINTKPEDSLKVVTFYEKDFIIGDYKANIKYGKITGKETEEIILTFGNTEFTGAMICNVRVNDKKTKEEFLTILQSIFLDKSVSIDYAALNNYTLDVSKSVFKFNKHSSTIFYYTVDGKGSTNKNFISIVRQSAVNGVEDMRNTSKTFIRRLENEYEMTIDHIQGNEVNIKGQPAYETIMRRTDGNPQSVYLLVIGNEKSSLSFLGIIDEDNTKLFEECKALAHTIQLK